MTNESDIPIFSAGPMTPVGQFNGMPVAPKKQAGSLMKRIMSHAKPPAKMKGKVTRKSSIGRPGKRGIEADSKVHFGSYPRYF